MITTWHTVKDAKVVYVPLGEKLNKKGELKMTFARTGIRVVMEDGSWWFHHFRSETWTHHWMGTKVEGRGFNAKNVPCEHKQSYTDSALKRDYKDRPAMLEALRSGYELALMAEQEARAA